MTTEAPHEHDWQPLPEHFMRYTCACGATGYRNLYSGKILAHTHRRADLLKPQPNVVHVSTRALRDGVARRGRSGPGPYG